MEDEEIEYKSAKKVASEREYSEATDTGDEIAYKKSSVMAAKKEREKPFMEWLGGKASKVANTLQERVKASEAYKRQSASQKRGGIHMKTRASTTKVFTTDPFSGGLKSQDPFSMGDPFGGSDPFGGGSRRRAAKARRRKVKRVRGDSFGDLF